jgi:lipid-binding SYLF domain-containing protein
VRSRTLIPTKTRPRASGVTRSGAAVMLTAAAFSLALIVTPTANSWATGASAAPSVSSRMSPAGEATVSSQVPSEAADEATQAAEAFRKVMSNPEHSIPQRVLDRAEAIGVFADIVQAAFIVGGRGGDGVISRKTADGWSVPAFFKLGGASIGAQIGGRKTDIVLVFTTKAAIDALLDDRLTLGAEVTATAGPVEATAAEATTTTTEDRVLIYSRDRGLFAGAALDGAVITPDNDLNRATYKTTAREILTGTTTIAPPAGVRVFLDALQRPKS